MIQQPQPIVAKSDGSRGSRILQSQIAGYFAVVLCTAAVTAVCAPFHDSISHTTVAFAFLLVVLFITILWGHWPGRAAAVLGMLCFNFFFLPPIYTFTIADPQNWVALAAFLITSSTVGHLSARAKQRAREAEASREEARLASTYNRSLIESSLDPLVTIGHDGKIADVNAATERITGHTRAELLGTDFSAYFTEPEKARAGYQQAFSQGFVRDYTLELQHSDGHVTSVFYNASVYRDASGNVSGVFAAARDITERKRTEENLLRINRAHRALSSCNQALIRATDESVWLEQICGIIVEEAGYRFCWVGMAEQEDSKAVRPIAYAGIEDGYLKTLNITWADTERGRGPTGTCIRTGETQYTRNMATDPRMGPWRAEALKRGYASSIAIPLFVDSKPFGVLTIYSSETEAFGSEEVQLLGELAGDLGYGITVIRTRTARIQALEEIRVLNSELEARVSVRTAQLQHVNQELEQAREREGEIGFRIQQTLLLDQPPRDIPSLRVAALTIPSQRIGGDFYIFLRHSEECLDVIVGDVMGKGIPGALLGAATKSHILRALSDLMAQSRNGKIPEPEEIVTLAHAQLVGHLIELDSFVTLCYTRLDVNRNRLTCVDCGHTGILQLHRKTGLCEILHGDNLPLGFREWEIYDQTSVPLHPGDLLLFFSDGITEARNSEEELFGVERLEESFRRNGDLDPAALVQTIREEVFAFAAPGQLADDLTCVAVRVDESLLALARAEMEIASDLKNLPGVREFVRTFCGGLPNRPLEEDDTGALVLAVDEAVCNIIKHAYHGHNDQRIHLEAVAFPGKLSVRLHHLGDPVDLSKVSPPAFDGSRDSGFGIYLISSSVDEVRYYRDERGRNCVNIVKNWKP